MDFIVDNPFAPVLLACLVTAAIFSTASWLTKWAWLATIAVPAVFLVAYVSTYQKIPPFPPVGAANKVFYVALAATLVAATDSFTIVPRSVLAGAVSLLASIWIGFAKLAEPNAET